MCSCLHEDIASVRLLKRHKSWKGIKDGGITESGSESRYAWCLVSLSLSQEEMIWQGSQSVPPVCVFSASLPVFCHHTFHHKLIISLNVCTPWSWSTCLWPPEEEIHIRRFPPGNNILCLTHHTLTPWRDEFYSLINITLLFFLFLFEGQDESSLIGVGISILFSVKCQHRS